MLNLKALPGWESNIPLIVTPFATTTGPRQDHRRPPVTRLQPCFRERSLEVVISQIGRPPFCYWLRRENHAPEPIAEAWPVLSLLLVCREATSRAPKTKTLTLEVA